MRALIVGAAGFVGGYLADELRRAEYKVYVTKLPHESFSSHAEKIFDTDVTDIASVRETIEASKPDVIFHLAAQSSVKLSWAKPEMTLNINVMGALNLLNVCREQYERGLCPRVILIGSSEEYGKVSPYDCPINEDTACHPGNIYAVSKLTQGCLAQVYNAAYGIDTVTVRAFNHTGPGQNTTFVTADFCSQAAEIALGKREPVITVGNLDAKRDFTDVRDIVRAYVLLAKHGRSGEIYNVGSGKAISIAELLEKVITAAGVDIEVKKDPARMRPSDVPLHYADISKLKKDTGWTPSITLDETVSDTLNYFKVKLKQN